MLSLRLYGRTDGAEHRTVSEAVREPLSRPGEWPAGPTAEATLLDQDGVTLTGIQGFRVLDDGRLLLGHVDNPGALLTYLFGRGQHEVMFSLVTGAVQGRLETCWAGSGRRWWLELDDVAGPV
jgi:hypothetical protein